MSHGDYKEDVAVEELGWLIAWWMRQQADEPDKKRDEASQAQNFPPTDAPAGARASAVGSDLGERVDGADMGSGTAGRVGGIAPR
jgi:hypothetical protein